MSSSAQVVSEGSCPSCGAPVAFTVGSARILVCGYCNTVVAREGTALLAEGKVAALAETQTPFRVGLEGRHSGVAFTFVGHLQRDYGAGIWDEWFLSFSDGREGWLSESEGQLHLMYPRGEEPALKLERLRPGRETSYAGRRVVVEEVRRAQLISAQGQLPSDLEHGSTVAVDATGPGGVFLTFDFGNRLENPEVFVGRSIELKALGIPDSELVHHKPKRVKLDAATCPKCNGALDFKAPDSAKRVGCPYCGALIDVSAGKLRFLTQLPDPDRDPVLPLGAKGTLAGTEWLVLGWMQRSTTVDRVVYPWHEYLLWARGVGFTFLMESNGHWTHLTPVPAGEVRVNVGTAAYFKGQRYRGFQHVTAVTETVRGEFYWKVKAGERAEATEYVAPPESINVDATNDEVSYTHGIYLQPGEVQAAFKIKRDLPVPEGIAPSQPDPGRARSSQTLTWAMGYAVAAVLLFVVMTALVPSKEVINDVVPVRVQGPPMVPGGGASPEVPDAVHFTPTFTIDRPSNAQVRYESPQLTNEWLGLQFDLISESGEVISQYHELSYYRGYDGGESWSEGRRSGSFFFSRLPKGTYSMRVVPSHGALSHNLDVRLTMETGVPRMLWLVLFLLAMGAVVAFQFLRRMSFETKRWSESNLGSDE